MGVVRTRAADAWLLALICTLGFLCGCTAGNGDDPATGIARYQSAPCPVPNFPGVPEADLGSNYSCGYLTVRENRSVPGGRTIRILVARVKAATATPKPDPIVFLAGGPGGAGTLSAPGVVAGGMNADRDVIFVNQRGTLHSDPHLSCPEMDEFAARSIGLVYAAASTAVLDRAAIAACRERLGRSDTASLAPAISAVPTLILAGTYDASTAPAWVAQVTPWLSNVEVLRFPGVGHGVLPTSACAQSIMTAYLDHPGATVDRACVATMKHPAFRIP